MTKEQKEFIFDQLTIIDEKIDEDNLIRYEALLGAARLSEEVSGYLKRACDLKHKELNPISPMAVGADFD